MGRMEGTTTTLSLLILLIFLTFLTFLLIFTFLTFFFTFYYKDAIKCFTTSIRLKPDFADAYANLAGAYRDSHRVDDAIT